MRIDVVSIFPDYLTPLGLSLPGKAQRAGLLDVRVHDLRDWTHDRHRTVDDTPYGGGAGMVMRPEPWGEALDAITADGAEGAEPLLLVPTPSGTPFSQAIAADLASRPWLVLACGRYEGIDQRVVDHARTRMQVVEVSIGDYVLNGGEAAALVISEAVVRLLPGFMGNAESLSEESHGESGLLEYPVYTKPPSWRGLDVPDVLLGGDHGKVAAWRREQAVRRTAERRPDLLHPSATVSVGGTDAELRPATRADLGEIQTLQWACFEPALREPLDVLTEDVLGSTSFVLRAGGRLVGTVRCQLLEDGGVWQIGLLMVPPDLRGRGLGRFLLDHAERVAPESAHTYRLYTGAAKAANLAMYKRAGYSLRGPRDGVADVMVLTKRSRR
jgi:tRNA (guanine37-N1)-methyltransferase